MTLECVERKGYFMKQVIVLVAMIILGVGIAGMVMGFETTATTITNGASTTITSTFDGEFDNGGN